MRHILFLGVLLLPVLAVARQTTVVDEFNREDGPLGSDWMQILPDGEVTIAGRVVQSSPVVVANQRVRAARAATAAAATYSAASFANDQFAQVTVRAPFYGGPYVRSTGTALTGWNNYEAYPNTSTNIRLARHVNNVPTTLANFQAPWNGIARIFNGDTLRLEARSTQLRVLLNGVEVGRVIDIAHHSGAPGVITHYGLLSPLDDFAAGDLR